MSDNNSCLSLWNSLTMGQLYDKEKDQDGFLYVAYSGENTFGVQVQVFYTTCG